MLESCVDGSRAYMRTYRKHTMPSMMSTLPRNSLLIPCRGPQQGNEIPCYATEIIPQSIEFAGTIRGNRENFPVVSLLAGTARCPSQPAGLNPPGVVTIGWRAAREGTQTVNRRM